MNARNESGPETARKRFCAGRDCDCRAHVFEPIKGVASWSRRGFLEAGTVAATVVTAVAAAGLILQKPSTAPGVDLAHTGPETKRSVGRQVAVIPDQARAAQVANVAKAVRGLQASQSAQIKIKLVHGRQKALERLPATNVDRLAARLLELQSERGYDFRINEVRLGLAERPRDAQASPVLERTLDHDRTEVFGALIQARDLQGASFQVTLKKSGSWYVLGDVTQPKTLQPSWLKTYLGARGILEIERVEIAALPPRQDRKVDDQMPPDNPQ